MRYQKLLLLLFVTTIIHSAFAQVTTDETSPFSLAPNYGVPGPLIPPYNFVYPDKRNNTKYARVKVDGQTLTLCVSQDKANTHLGVVVKKGCLTNYDGYAHIQPDYKVMQGNPPLQWEPPFSPLDNLQAAVVGYENGESMFFCKVSYKNKTYIGKNADQLNGCDITYVGREIHLTKDYQILYYRIPTSDNAEQ